MVLTLTLAIVDLTLAFFMIFPVYSAIASGAIDPFANIFEPKVISRSLLYAAAIVAFTLVWILTLRPRHIPKSRIGIVIAIKAENEIEYIRLRNDFIKALVSHLGRADQQITVLSLNEYHANRLLKNIRNIPFYHKKTNSRLLVYGSCCTRLQGGKPFYYLNINSSVHHLPIPIQLSKIIGEQMIEVLPQMHLIAVDNELIGFKLMSDYFSFVARYLLGISAYVSRDAK